MGQGLHCDSVGCWHQASASLGEQLQFPRTPLLAAPLPGPARPLLWFSQELLQLVVHCLPPWGCCLSKVILHSHGAAVLPGPALPRHSQGSGPPAGEPGGWLQPLAKGSCCGAGPRQQSARLLLWPREVGGPPEPGEPMGVAAGWAVAVGAIHSPEGSARTLPPARPRSCHIWGGAARETQPRGGGRTGPPVWGPETAQAAGAVAQDGPARDTGPRIQGARGRRGPVAGGGSSNPAGAGQPGLGAAIRHLPGTGQGNEGSEAKLGGGWGGAESRSGHITGVPPPPLQLPRLTELRGGV